MYHKLSLRKMRVRESANPSVHSRKYLYICIHAYIHPKQREKTTACQINPSARLRERFISLDYIICLEAELMRTYADRYFFIYVLHCVPYYTRQTGYILPDFLSVNPQRMRRVRKYFPFLLWHY